jgi:hypothetical protein
MSYASDPISELERLAKLRESGALTDAEFAQEKRRLLGHRDAPVVQVITRQRRAEKEKRGFSVVSFTLNIFILVGSAAILLLLLSASGPLSKAVKQIFPRSVAAVANAVPLVPAPIVVQATSDGSRSTLFHGKLDVNAEVLNNGAPGYITVRTNVFQGDRVHERHERRYMARAERFVFSFAFNRLRPGSEARYEVNAVAE